MEHIVKIPKIGDLVKNKNACPWDATHTTNSIAICLGWHNGRHINMLFLGERGLIHLWPSDVVIIQPYTD